jgi:hypothetical protein
MRALLVVNLFLSTLPIWSQSGDPGKLEQVQFQGSIRSRFEMWDWFQGTQGDGSYSYSGNILRFGVSQALGRFDWQLEFAAPVLLGLPENAVKPAPQGLLGLGGNYYSANDASRNAASLFPKQAFVRWKGLFGDKRQSLRLGRFEFSDGGEVTPANATLAFLKRDRINQRILGPFAWTHVGRSFDGFHYIFNQPQLNVTWLGALPTRGVFQSDGWGNLKVAFSYLSLTTPYGQKDKKQSGELRIFGLYYHDFRHILKTDNRPLDLRRADTGNIRVGSYGGHYLHAAETNWGTADFIAWFVAQTGRWGNLDHRAFAYVFEGGLQPKFAWKPWLRAGWFHGSGDQDPLDRRHGAFFQVLPTPRPFARFPFFDLMNNEDLMASLAVRPHAKVTVNPQIHWLRLSSRRDLWYLGGGVFQPWTFGYIGRPSNGNRGLATLYDVSVDYSFSKSWSFTGYFGHTNGKMVPAAIYERDRNANFSYLEATYRF